MTLAPYLPHGEVTEYVVSSAIGNFAKLQLGASGGLTASTTQTRAGALMLTKALNWLSTVANSGDAVRLASSALGAFNIVINTGAHPATIFPPGVGDTIDGQSQATLTNEKAAIFFAVAAGVWISAQLGSPSA